MARHHLLLLVLVPILLSAASAATHSPETESTAASRTHHHHHHGTATAHFHPVPSATPSMHQNHLDSQSQSLLLDPFVADAQAADAELGAETSPAPLLPPPPPTVQPDLASQPQEGSDSEPSPSTTPAASTTTLLPLPTTAATASPPPVQAGLDAGPSDAEQGLQQLSRVLTSLGYNEMASAAPLLVDEPPLARWPGAITVFAAPDAFLQASCPMCSRHHLLLQHIAMGYYPYAELASAATMKIPSAAVGLCLKIASQRGPFGVHYARIFADGVEVSHPELYNDGRYVVHGLHGFLRPLTHSCFDDIPPRHAARSAHSSSKATAASVVRIMLRDAIARLRDGGYGFVALAMRVKFADLERFANVTLFALDDQAIFVGGGHDYVSAVRFHVVPDHRLTRADLRRLRPGTILPTMAGEGQSLVVTHASNHDVRINYIPIKDPDVVVNSRVAVHGVYVPFPRIHLANLAASVAVASDADINATCGFGGPFGVDCTSPKMRA
ncbi:uncharacterized protein [Lolium perenne]|uniref:uncharacterized protein n=1 Tax=Lolium perenne TaxID=4522 RepID=UPI0021EA827B|nr:uncharacterized protein LOC127298570 [Lolium perenne]